MSEADAATRDHFLSLVDQSAPQMASHDEISWPDEWRPRLAETREWASSMLGEDEVGYFGDGSTGTVDDFEHGEYLQMLAERND